MPLLWLSLAFLTGIVLAASLPLSAGGWLMLVGLAVLTLFLRWLALKRVRQMPDPKQQVDSNPPHRLATLAGRAMTGLRQFHLPVPVFTLILALAFGALRYQMAQPRLDDPGQIAYYNDTGTVYQVEAILLAPPEVRETRADLRLRAESMRLLEGGAPVTVRGDLLATTWDWQDYRYGDRLRLQGTLETPPEGEEFSYRQYLVRQGIYTTVQPDEIELLERGQGNPVLAGIYAFKQRALDTLYLIYPDPEASLIAGILLGVESGIPEEVERAFQDSGTAHIVAISGFYMSTVSAPGLPSKSLCALHECPIEFKRNSHIGFLSVGRAYLFFSIHSRAKH